MNNAIEITVIGRLLETGTVKASARNHKLISRFEIARWIDPSGRKNEWKARELALEMLTKRLNELLPSWQDDFAFLRSISRNPFDPSDIELISTLRRPVALREMINRRSWNATRGLGPKHHFRMAAEVTLTKDWVARFRPNLGLCGVADEGQIDFSGISSSLTECFLPERAWFKIREMSGILPRLVITCENIAAYVDLPVNQSIMVIYSPGADTEPAIKMLNILPSVPWVHFGDYDHEGIEIAKRISVETKRSLDLFVPQFAVEYLSSARDVKTPWGEIPNDPIFVELKHHRKRIFQEVFMLDERLAIELENLCISGVANEAQ